jgi:hypothetical protein
VANLFVADTGHSGGVADTERVVFIHHNPSREKLFEVKKPLYVTMRIVYF